MNNVFNFYVSEHETDADEQKFSHSVLKNSGALHLDKNFARELNCLAERLAPWFNQQFGPTVSQMYNDQVPIGKSPTAEGDAHCQLPEMAEDYGSNCVAEVNASRCVTLNYNLNTDDFCLSCDRSFETVRVFLASTWRIGGHSRSRKLARRLLQCIDWQLGA